MFEPLLIKHQSEIKVLKEKPSKGFEGVNLSVMGISACFTAGVTEADFDSRRI